MKTMKKKLRFGKYGSAVIIGLSAIVFAPDEIRAADNPGQQSATPVPSVETAEEKRQAAQRRARRAAALASKGSSTPESNPSPQPPTEDNTVTQPAVRTADEGRQAALRLAKRAATLALASKSSSPPEPNPLLQAPTEDSKTQTVTQPSVRTAEERGQAAQRRARRAAALALASEGSSTSKSNPSLKASTEDNKPQTVTQPPLGTAEAERPAAEWRAQQAAQYQSGVKTAPVSDVVYVPSAPIRNMPPAASYDAKNVKIGVFDYGFGPASKREPEVAGRLRKKLSPPYSGGVMAGSKTSHGKGVSRILVNDAEAVELYQADVPDLPFADNIGVGLETLAGEGVKIVNNSWSMPPYDKMPHTALGREQLAVDFKEFLDVYSKAVTERDQLLVYAIGNDRKPEPFIIAGAPYLRPELEKGWLAVTSFDKGQHVGKVNKCGYASNWCLAADGTASSASAPKVSAAAGRVSQAFPWMSNSELRQTILSTASNGGPDGTGPDRIIGWGRLNADKAVYGPALFDKRLALGNAFQADTKGYDADFYNDIGGDAGLHKAGAGTLTLWGNNSYTGISTVADGALAVYGTQSSGVVVGDRGTLVSNGGRIRGDVSNNYIVEVSGAGLTVDGNYSNEHKGAVLALQLGSQLTVNGEASLNESKLLVAKPDAHYVVNASEPAIVANSIIGKFSEIKTADGLMYRITPRYSDKGLDLLTERVSTIVLAGDLYPGDEERLAAAHAVEAALQEVDAYQVGQAPTITPEFIEGVTQLQGETSPIALAASLDSFSGQIYASSQAMAFQQSQAVNRALSDRVDSLSLNGAQSGIWAGLLGGEGKLERNGFARGNIHFAGGQIGMDHRITPRSILGGAFSFSDASARFIERGGKSDSTVVGLSLYSRHGYEVGTYISGRVGQSWISTDTKRDIIVRNKLAPVKSDRTDRMTSLSAELGHTLTLNETRVTPFVGASYDYLKRGNISESGSAFALKGDKKSYDQAAASIGLRLQSQSLKWANVESTVTGYGAYRYGNATSLNYSAAFAGAPDARSEFKGIGLQRHTGWLGLGVSTSMTDRIHWNVNYDMLIGRGGINNNVISGGLKYAFG